jgi:hypothetical protein
MGIINKESLATDSSDGQAMETEKITPDGRIGDCVVSSGEVAKIVVSY